jgi:magnesium chelatase family protein
VGGALLDRIDIRVPLTPVPTAVMCAPPKIQEGALAKKRVASAAALQRARYAGQDFSWNARIPSNLMDKYCALDGECRDTLLSSSEALNISSRAFHSLLRVSRTIADLEGSPAIRPEHICEAVQHRRYGDSDYCWTRA